MISLLIILFISLYLPTLFAFDIDTTESKLIFIDFFIDSWFIIEIGLNFLTAFYEKGILVMNKKRIAKNYLKTWLMVDLVSSIPFSFF